MTVLMHQNNDVLSTRTIRRGEDGEVYLTFGEGIGTEITIVMTQEQLDELAVEIKDLPPVIKPEVWVHPVDSFHVGEEVHWYDTEGIRIDATVVRQSESDPGVYEVRLGSTYGEGVVIEKLASSLFSDCPF